MRLELDNAWARVVQADGPELKWLDAYISCDELKFNGGDVREVKFRMFDLALKRFPTGLVPVVAKGAARDGVALEVDDRRRAPCAQDLQADLGWLRDYQLDAVNAVCQRGGRGMVKVPTGGGKTEIFIGLTRALPCEWLFVVHRSDIVTQSADRYQLRTGERAGTFEGGRWRRGTCNVTVSTFQALARGLKRQDRECLDFLHAVEGINVDESHAQPADSFFGVTMAMPNAYYRVGQSGTPMDRADKDSLRTIGALGPVLYKIKTQRLIDAGVLSRATVRMVKCEQQSTPDASWRDVYSSLVVGSGERNKTLAEIVDRAKKPCLCFVDETQHGELLAKHLERRGLKVDFVHGGHWKDKRKQKINTLVAGDADVLLCTVIFQEGIDIPSLRSVVNGAGKSSAVASLQRMGRGMRVERDAKGNAVEGGDEFELWDVYDQGQKWLQRHALERFRTYEKEGHVVEVLDL